MEQGLFPVTFGQEMRARTFYTSRVQDARDQEYYPGIASGTHVLELGLGARLGSLGASGL